MPRHRKHSDTSVVSKGTVFDAEGNPVPNAEVFLRCLRVVSEDCERSVRTGELGQFQFECNWKVAQVRQVKGTPGHDFVEQQFYVGQKFRPGGEHPIEVHVSAYMRPLLWEFYRENRLEKLPLILRPTNPSRLTSPSEIPAPQWGPGSSGEVRGVENRGYSVFARHPSGAIWWIEDIHPPMTWGGGKFSLPHCIQPEWYLKFKDGTEPLSTGTLWLKQGPLIRDVDIYQSILQGNYSAYLTDPFLRVRDEISIGTSNHVEIMAERRGMAVLYFPEELNELANTTKELQVGLRLQNSNDERITDYHCVFESDEQLWFLEQVPVGLHSIHLFAAWSTKINERSKPTSNLVGWSTGFVSSPGRRVNIMQWASWGTSEELKALQQSQPVEKVNPWEYWNIND